MPQFVFGGKDNLLNVAHIAGLRVCDGTINERVHWRDAETYGFCPVAEMINGQMHELARWRVKHVALSARMKLIESMGNDKKNPLRLW